MKFHNKFLGTVEAIQWRTNVDHPAVELYPYPNPTEQCTWCFRKLKDHGWLGDDSLTTFVRPMCPGDWVVDDGTGGYFHVGQSLFPSTYEETP